MLTCTLGEVAAVVGGTVAPANAAALQVTGPASLDSRTVVPGGLFVAVAGTQVDGHDFVPAARAAGAVAVLGNRPTELPTVVVDDCATALGRLAHHHVAHAPGLRVHAMTGSQGKTGTKDYLTAILSAAGPTVATTGNLNNEWGVPLTALRITAETRYLIVEMGARGVGHIRYLAETVPPHVAAVINVGVAHLGEFGSRERIAQAKGELVEALPSDGVAVLNADDPMTRAMASRTSARVLTFGETGDVAWRGLQVDAWGRPAFELGVAGRWEPVRLEQMGVHQVANAVAAAAMAIAEGISLPPIAEALTRTREVSRWRMERCERADGLVVINDAYNANPTSTRAALDALRGIGAATGRRTLAVLGEMRELGQGAEAAHRDVGVVAAASADVVVTVGAAAAELAAGAEAAGAHLVVRTTGRAEATEWVRHNVSADDVVLVKASRGVALEHLVEALMQS